MWTWQNTPPMYPQYQQTGPTIQDIIMGQQWLDSLKKTFEEEEKKKKEKKKNPELPKFSFGELWGAVMFFSIPITIGQLLLLQYVQHQLNAIFH